MRHEKMALVLMVLAMWAVVMEADAVLAAKPSPRPSPAASPSPSPSPEAAGLPAVMKDIRLARMTGSEVPCDPPQMQITARDAGGGVMRMEKQSACRGLIKPNDWHPGRDVPYRFTSEAGVSGGVLWFHEDAK